MRTWKLTLATGIAASAAVAAQMQARAIPAFARKYHTTCARCHSVVPRLNNYGWAFKLRGFRVPGDEGVGKILMPEDKALELLDSLPLAMRIQGSLAGSTGKGNTSSNQLDSEIDLLSAGTPAPRMGYWAEIDTIKNEDGTGGYSSEIGNVRAIFTDLVSHHPTRLNLEVGKFNIDEFGISTGRILTQTPYAIYAVDPTGMGVAEQDEVTGLNFFGAIGTGIGKGVPEAKTKAGEAGKVTSAEEKEMEAELNQSEAKPPPESPQLIAARAVLDVLVKKGTITQQDADDTLSELAQKLPPPPTPPVSATPTEPAGPMEISKSDYDVRKGLFYQAGLVTRGDVGSSKIQGYARLSYANPAGWWIGPVVYVGSNTFNLGPTSSQPSFTDGFQRYGLEADINFGPHRNIAGVSRRAMELLMAYQKGEDSNVGSGLSHVSHSGGFVEATYLADDKDLFDVRWDRLDSAREPVLNVDTITLNYTRYLQRNLKAGIEFVPDLQGGSSTHVPGNAWYLFYDFAL